MPSDLIFLGMAEINKGWADPSGRRWGQVKIEHVRRGLGVYSSPGGQGTAAPSWVSCELRQAPSGRVIAGADTAGIDVTICQVDPSGVIHT